MNIPQKYQPQLITKEGYFKWSLDFFSDPNVIQSPYIDITLQLEVTNAYNLYKEHKLESSTFFSFLLWNLVQTIKNHPDFRMRLVDDQWYILDNPSVITPVAIGGKERFNELYLEDVSNISYQEFVKEYNRQLLNIRNGKGKRENPQIFTLSMMIGNLPNLQFTGLNLHWRQSNIAAAPWFYFGKRYWQNDKLYIPFAVKLHHSCSDPFVFNLLMEDFNKRFYDN